MNFLILLLILVDIIGTWTIAYYFNKLIKAYHQVDDISQEELDELYKSFNKEKK